MAASWKKCGIISYLKHFINTRVVGENGFKLPSTVNEDVSDAFLSN